MFLEMEVSYLSILLYMIIAGVISGAVVLLPVFVAKITGSQNQYKEKISPYECGFEPIGDVRPNKFNIKFYLVAILFVIFDLEIAFMFPWAVTLKQIGVFGFVSMMIFLAVLTLGFIYEWKKGALEW
jgi:NADH-quinone oxidoreductase subunit A